MENFKCPSWLKPHIKEIVHKENPAVVSLCSSSGNELLELKFIMKVPRLAINKHDK